MNTFIYNCASYTIKKILRRFGLDIVQFIPKNDQNLSRKILISNFQINFIIDIGANKGQFAESLFKNGYSQKILSIEPMTKEHNHIKRLSKKNDKWLIYNKCAVGDTFKKTKINISENSVSSSILNIKDSHIKIDNKAGYIGSEDIEIVTLDSIFDNLIWIEKMNVYLKIDAQGYEEYVLNGFKKYISTVKVIEIESSFFNLYDNNFLFKELVSFLENKNFVLWNIHPEVYDNTNARLAQANLIFVNEKFIKSN